MINDNMLLARNEDCITVRSKGNWSIYNPITQTAIVAEDLTIAVLSMIEVPKYYGELKLECLAHYPQLDSNGFNDSISILINAGIIAVNANSIINRDSLIFDSYPNLPEYISVHPTHRCNLVCDYCYNKNHREKTPSKERTDSEWRELLVMFQSKGVKRFDITGGEPLLRQDMLPLYKELKEKGAQLELLTNGIEINNISTAYKIRDSFTRVSVSLDSSVESEHDCYRGKGTYQKVISALKYLTETGVVWQAKGVLHDKNSGSLKATKELVLNLGGKAYDLSIMIGSTRNDNSIYAQFYETTIKQRVENGEADLYYDPEFDINKKYGAPCSAARYECAIDAYGEVFPCRVFMTAELSCGNAFEQNFETIWNESEVLKGVRETDFTKVEGCGTCKFLRLCLGGCRAIAYADSGDMLARVDAFSCSLRKRKINNIINRHVNGYNKVN